jgi:hypothetical protein
MLFLKIESALISYLGSYFFFKILAPVSCVIDKGSNNISGKEGELMFLSHVHGMSVVYDIWILY